MTAAVNRRRYDALEKAAEVIAVSPPRSWVGMDSVPGDRASGGRTQRFEQELGGGCPQQE